MDEDLRAWQGLSSRHYCIMALNTANQDGAWGEVPERPPGCVCMCPGMLVPLPHECSCPLLTGATCNSFFSPKLFSCQVSGPLPRKVPFYVRDSTLEDDAPDPCFAASLSRAHPPALCPGITHLFLGLAHFALDSVPAPLGGTQVGLWPSFLSPHPPTPNSFLRFLPWQTVGPVISC